MKKKYIIYALFWGGCIGLIAACSGEKSVEDQLKAVVMENFKTTEAENMSAMLDTIHTQSPFYAQTEKLAVQIFDAYDLKYELLEFKYVGLDGEDAIAEYKFSTKKVAGGVFKDNIINTRQKFRQEDGNRKIWSMAILEIDYINE